MSGNSIVKVRRSSTPSSVPSSGSLSEGQIAINIADKLMFVGNSSGDPVSLGGLGQAITLSGDITGSGIATSITTTLATSGVTAGTYNEVTVDAKGRVTSGTNNKYVVNLTTTTANQVLDTFDITQIRSAKYEMQIENEASFFVHVSEVRVFHNGTTPQFIEYGVMYSDSILATFDVSITGNTFNLLVTPINADTTFTFIRNTMNI